MLTKAQNYNNNSNIMKILQFNSIQNVIYSWDYQKSLYYANLVLKKLFLLLSMLKTVVLLNIFEETVLDF